MKHKLDHLLPGPRSFIFGSYPSFLPYFSASWDLFWRWWLTMCLRSALNSSLTPIRATANVLLAIKRGHEVLYGIPNASFHIHIKRHKEESQRKWTISPRVKIKWHWISQTGCQQMWGQRVWPNGTLYTAGQLYVNPVLYLCAACRQILSAAWLHWARFMPAQ